MIARIFVHAFVRRIAIALAVLALSYVGMSRAEAATMNQAYTSCVSYRDAFPSAGKENFAITYNCSPEGLSAYKFQATWTRSDGVPTSDTSIYDFLPACAAGTVPDQRGDGTCDPPCSSRPDDHFLGYALSPNDVYCDGYCERMQQASDAGGGQSALGGTCPSGKPNCPTASGNYELVNNAFVPGGQVCRPIDADHDGTPDGDDDFPTNPDEDTDSDGDGIGDNGDHKPTDPTDGKDEDDEGGDEGDNVSHGGGNCNTPPESTGDGILTQIAYQTWKTNCTLESVRDGGALKIKGTGTDGGIAVIGGSGPGGTGTCDPYTDPTCVPKYLAGDEGDTSAGDTDLWDTGTGSGWSPDEGGFGLSRSCPAPPTITLAGTVRTLDTSGLCELAGIIGALVLLMAAAHAFWALAQS